MFSGYRLGMALVGLIGYLVVTLTGVDLGPYVTRLVASGFGLLFFLSAYFAAYTAMNRYQSKAEADFYAASKRARLDRLHRVICSLYRQGRTLPPGDHVAEKWDREVRAALTRYGGTYLAQHYLSWAGRTDRDLTITADQLRSELDLLDQWLAGDFWNEAE